MPVIKISDEVKKILDKFRIDNYHDIKKIHTPGHYNYCGSSYDQTIAYLLRKAAEK